MYIVIITSFIALILTYFDSKNQMRNGMFLGFVLLTTLGVIHYDYGNDYMGYYHIFDEIVRYPLNLDNLMSKDIFKEPGWAILCHIFKDLGGFFMMVAVLNVIQNILVYHFIKANVEKKWWAIAIFIYMCSTNLYLLNFSMMRQGFVVCVFLGTWNLIKNKKWWWALLILYLCSFIHSSAKILLPFAFWGFIPRNKGKVFAAIYGILFISVWLSSDFLNNIFNLFVGIEDVQDYIDTYEDIGNKGNYGIGFIMNLMPFFVALYYLLTNKTNDAKQKIVLLSMLSFIVAPFVQIIPMIGRFGTYFSIFNITSIPIIYNSIKNRMFRLGLFAIYIIMTLYDYWIFFNDGIYAKSYKVFHSIFEVM